VDLTAAESGSRPSPAEHPLAGSRAPRTLFVRATDGSAVSSAGLALTGVPPSQVRPADRTRVLAGDDRFADPGIPMLFGLERGQIGILGARLQTVTERRRLPTSIRVSDDPDTLGLRDAPDGTPDRHSTVLDRIFDRGGIRSELLDLNALREPESTFDQAFLGGRVLLDQAPGNGEEHWKPGLIAAGLLPSGAISWQPYRLPGLSVVDAWGREVLVSIDDRGALTLISAGADGVFVIDPGTDGILDSSDPRAPAANGDRDGRRDNLMSGQGP
jgi:hypothetical protein